MDNKELYLDKSIEEYDLDVTTNDTFKGESRELLEIDNSSL